MWPTTCIRRSITWSAETDVEKTGGVAMMRRGFISVPLLVMLFAGIALMDYPQSAAQVDAGCEPDGYRVIARRWDVVLKTGWELRQDCGHPEWPTHSVPVAMLAQSDIVRSSESVPLMRPLMIHAGDRVRLWMQDTRVRIEMSGVAAQSARVGERIMIQVARPLDGGGSTVESIPGLVRGTGDVEMER